jgi:hypothetical protein
VALEKKVEKYSTVGGKSKKSIKEELFTGTSLKL